MVLYIRSNKGLQAMQQASVNLIKIHIGNLQCLAQCLAQCPSLSVVKESNEFKNLGSFCEYNSMETYKWLYTLLMLILNQFCLEATASANFEKNSINVKSELKMQERDFYSRLDPFIRQKIHKRGLNKKENTYVWFDTEFAKKYIEQNTLVSYPWGVSIITFVLQSLSLPYTISSFDYKTNKVIKIRQNSSISSYIVSNQNIETIIQLRINYIRQIKFGRQEGNIIVLIESLRLIVVQLKGIVEIENKAQTLFCMQRTVVLYYLTFDTSKKIKERLKISTGKANPQIDKSYKQQAIMLLDLIKDISTSKLKIQEGKDKLKDAIQKVHKKYMDYTKLLELSSTLSFLTKKGWVEWCLHTMAARYNATMFILRNGYARVRGEERSNSKNTIYISIFFLFWMGLFLFFPSFLESVSGIDIYNSTDSEYFRYFGEIRKILAIGFGYLLFYFLIFLKYRLNLSIPIFNKNLISTIIIIGGFEGLGEPELEERPTKSLTVLEQMKDKDFLNDLFRIKPEVKEESTLFNPEASNSKQANTSTESKASSAYPYWPRATHVSNLATLPESNSEPEQTKEDNNKKVRIKGFIDVKEITESGLGENKQDSIELEPKYKVKGFKKNYHYNWESTVNWQKNYPQVEEENRPEIEILYQKLNAEQIKYKSSNSLPETNTENSKWEINNPTASLNLVKHIKKIIKKLK